LNRTKTIAYNTFEDIEVRKTLKFKSEMQHALSHVSKSNFGIEIDCDAVKDMPSSAMTPSGFSTNQARCFVSHIGAHKNGTYLHICEAAPKKTNKTKVGKFISYLITDFIKAHGY
jgi:formiminoglutamase